MQAKAAIDPQPSKHAGVEAGMGDAQARGRLRAGDGAAVHPLHLKSARRNAGALGRRVRAPLFLAWQLTNRCSARCIACCEESGPDKAWRDELDRAEALDLARRIAESGIPLRRVRRRRAARRRRTAGTLRAPDRGRRRAQDRDRRQPHRRRGRRSARARLPCSACRSRSTAPPRLRTSACGRVELRRGDWRDPSAWSRAAIAPQLVFVPTRHNLHEMRRSATTSRCQPRLQRLRHRAADAASAAPRPTGTASPAPTSEWQHARSSTLRERAAVDARRNRAVDLSLGHRHGDRDARCEQPAGDAARRAQRQGQAAERAAVLAGGPARDSLETAWVAYRDAWRIAEVRRSSARAGRIPSCCFMQRDVGDERGVPTL